MGRLSPTEKRYVPLFISSSVDLLKNCVWIPFPNQRPTVVNCGCWLGSSRVTEKMNHWALWEFLDWVNWHGTAHHTCGQYHSTGWGPRLNESEKAHGNPGVHASLLPDYEDNVTSGLTLLPPCFLHCAGLHSDWNEPACLSCLSRYVVIRK